MILCRLFRCQRTSESCFTVSPPATGPFYNFFYDFFSPLKFCRQTSAELVCRSKRGCNGGTPCEQCVRRNQQCTYSQRRKSGPRGRPVRQHAQATDGTATSNVGTRISARKKTGSFMSPRLLSRSSTVSSTTSSPSRTASVSSSSSEYSPSEESDSEAENLSAEIRDAGSQIHVTKKGKISGSEVILRTSTSEQVSGPENQNENKPAVAKETGTTQGPSTPTAVSTKVSVTLSPEERATAFQTSETVHGVPDKASWTQPQPKVETSVKLNYNRQSQEQQPQEQHSATNPGISWSNGSLIHEISMQPWEISSETPPRPVAWDQAIPGGRSSTTEETFAAKPTAVKSSLQQQQQSSKATDNLPGDVDVYEAMDTTVVGVTATAAAPAASAAGESSFGGSLLKPCDDDDLGDFSLDIGCTTWEIPSLTREMSLARAVEALGGEQQASGFEYEGSFVSSW